MFSSEKPCSNRYDCKGMLLQLARSGQVRAAFGLCSGVVLT